MNRLNKKKIIFGIVLLIILGILYWIASKQDILSKFEDSSAIQEYISHLGIWGPFMLIICMVVAIVLSPLPSAPLAIAAGYTFGPITGAIYCLIGAEIGALTAFLISRTLGREWLHKRFGKTVNWKSLNSKKSLTIFIFIARLIPFVSFDFVSYAAGLTVITPFRFATATLIGMMPVTFLLTYFGNDLLLHHIRPYIMLLLIILFLSLFFIIGKYMFNHYFDE